MKSKSWIISTLVIGAALLAGCGGEKEGAASEGPTPRIEDKAYLKTLEKQRDERKSIMKRVDDARRELKAAKDETPVDEAKVARLEAALEDAVNDFKKNREESQAIVAERIHRELNEKKDSKKKGN